MALSSGSTIPAFGHHVIMLLKVFQVPVQKVLHMADTKSSLLAPMTAECIPLTLTVLIKEKN
jgi:hypothetical protein